ncbi:MAG: hypothetical protein LBI95_02490 [Holosporales bacterium]|jgi:hypothetical protein|nr:hypothetical protein [Holosporales bacterium]
MVYGLFRPDHAGFRVIRRKVIPLLEGIKKNYYVVILQHNKNIMPN